MMTTTLNGNILTVNTGISQELANKAFSAMRAFDEDGNEVCRINVDKSGGKGQICQFGLTCNTVVDGNLAVQIVLPMESSLDDVKKMYGKALVEVNKHINGIKAALNDEIAAINGIFSEQQ